MEISIHAPRVGSDTPHNSLFWVHQHFNPRSPCGERRCALAQPLYMSTISIHAPRVGSDLALFVGTLAIIISIHAPRVGSDFFLLKNCVYSISISIHAPRVGSDLMMYTSPSCVVLFQSTLPVWGATGWGTGQLQGKRNFNPRSPCGERRRGWGSCNCTPANFNPRSPCGERQTTLQQPPYRVVHFNPRSPCGERLFLRALLHTRRNFNPRSPCGERPVWVVWRVQVSAISIHAPRVGSDVPVVHGWWLTWISIHAPRVGSDAKPLGGGSSWAIFQSTLPVWGATNGTALRGADLAISIHAPRVGSDGYAVTLLLLDNNFNPRSPCGERLNYFWDEA